MSAPPNREILDYLRQADGGIYELQDCLQALLNSNGDRELALEYLRQADEESVRRLGVHFLRPCLTTPTKFIGAWVLSG